MAAINDLVAQIKDDDLRRRIEAELKRVLKHKKFGLVFEDHLPEGLTDGPIYPGLEVMDWVKGRSEPSPWHALIEADNYYALQLLAYLYPAQVDCIYIDPPYNTGARDWKYNNDYVDTADTYRHSKWLSMMKRRLLLAKRLLNPKDSVLIVTIDEKEYLHLGCLLEELFPEARMQMVSSVINPKGNRRDNEFSRCEEYLFFLYFGDAAISTIGSDMLRDNEVDSNDEDKSIRLRALLRGASNHGKRSDRPNLFYPLLFDKRNGKFVGHGEVPPIDYDRNLYIPPKDTIAMWPIGANGTELTWNLQPSTLMEKYNNHLLSFGKWDGEKRVGYYLSEGQEENLKKGIYDIVGQDEDGAYIIKLKDSTKKDIRPLTIWNKKSHSASDYGTSMLNNIFGNRRFSFPKSLYAVHDTIRFFVANKPNALIVDFFAGSGTTLHAVNLLNKEDGGHRRCIMVTNNEVSAEEAKTLTARGFKPGDKEWERLGIAQYVTWPRTICSIKGVDINGQPLKGNYLGTQAFPMAEGFDSNCIFFRLRFLDKDNVALGKQFAELLPLLWLKSGAKGMCPMMPSAGETPAPQTTTAGGDTCVPNMLVLPDNGFAVLNEPKAFAEFVEQIVEAEAIRDIYLIVDSDTMFREMSKALVAAMPSSRTIRTCQLYRDYLDNFRINTPR